MRTLVHLTLLALLSAGAVHAQTALTADTVSAPDSTPTDSIFLRAQRLAAEGQGDSARALVAAQLDSAAPGSPRYVEALWWSAVVASSAADAERDLRRIIVEYPLAPRSDDALMRLAQLEMTRGESDQALGHLERVLVEHPDSPSRARAAFWMARVLFDQGQAPQACRRLGEAMQAAPESQVELRNQIDYLDQRCAGVDTTAVAAAPAKDTARGARAGTAPPTASTAPRSSGGAASSTPTTPARGAPAAGTRYTVQVAAFAAKASADALAKRLADRGFESRVYGTTKPYRVRVGSYATRDEAEAVRRRLARHGVSGVVMEAERP